MDGARATHIDSEFQFNDFFFFFRFRNKRAFCASHLLFPQQFFFVQFASIFTAVREKTKQENYVTHILSL